MHRLRNNGVWPGWEDISLLAHGRQNVAAGDAAPAAIPAVASADVDADAADADTGFDLLAEVTAGPRPRGRGRGQGQGNVCSALRDSGGVAA